MASSYLPQKLVHIPPTPASDNHLPPAVESSSEGIISSNTITDIYSLDASGKPAFTHTSNPFLATPSLQGPQGKHIQFLVVIDNGTMINTIDTAAYQWVAQQLAPLGLSTCTLQMANGPLVASLGIWNGTLEWGPLHIHTSFKVFPSGSSWHMLMGKPLLKQIKAFQDYRSDLITVHMNNKSHQFHKFSSFHPLSSPSLPTAISFPDVAQFAPSPGNQDPPDTSSPLVTSLDQIHDVAVIEAPKSLISDVFVL